MYNAQWHYIVVSWWLLKVLIPRVYKCLSISQSQKPWFLSANWIRISYPDTLPDPIMGTGICSPHIGNMEKLGCGSGCRSSGSEFREQNKQNPVVKKKNTYSDTIQNKKATQIRPLWKPRILKWICLLICNIKIIADIITLVNRYWNIIWV